MRLKPDENLPRSLKERLSALGHDAQTVAEEGLLSQPDERVAEAARAEGRLLFTLDRRLCDVRRFPPGTHPGIVVFRTAEVGLTAVTEFVCRFAASGPLDNHPACVTVVEPGRIRVRRP